MTRRLLVGGLALAVVAGVFVFIQPRRTGGVWTRHQDAIEEARREELKKTMAAHPEIAKPMASYRVHEEKKAEGMVHRGGGYVAETSSKGLHFEASGNFLDLRAANLQQGETKIVCSEGVVSNPSFGDVRIDRGCLVEQYIFENTRAEQIIRVPQAIGDGALRVTVAARTDLTGKVTQVKRTDGGWMDTTLQDGGLAFADARGKKKIAYHGAMAIDAEGRRTDLDPTYSNDQITLEVPAAFMATATYPIAIDPWLELDFSASGGGITNSTGVSQTPSVVVIGGGNPWVAWSEQVTSGGISNFEVFFRYWNGVAWKNLAGSDTGNGISSNSGDSINPSLAEGEFGPDIAWQDDTSGTSCIYFRRWNGTLWEELSSTTPFNGNPTMTSANTSGGISFGIGTVSNYPSLSEFIVAVPTTGNVHRVPVIAYQSTNPGPTSIVCAAWWPGDPGAAATFDPSGVQLTPNFPVIPQGWYAVGGGAFASSYPGIQMSNTPSGFASLKPSLAIPSGTHSATVAWHDTRNGTHDIMVAQFSEAAPGTGGNPGNNLPLFPQSRPPNFAFGIWNGFGTSFAAGGITANPPATFPFSINPSLALIGSNPTVAWEQVFSLTDSDIYLLQWNGASWVQLGTSASGNGLSNTPGTISANPSLGIEAGVPIVAWQDDESGNSEIYVRRFTGGVWNEVGFQSFSASVGPIPGIGGISQTPSSSLTPSISSNSGPTVAWQDFSQGTPQIFVRRFFENEPLFLIQTTVGGATIIPFGGNTTDTIIELRATAFSENTARLVRMQVEVVPMGSPFVGRVTQESGEVTIDPVTHQGTAEMVIQFTGLVNVTYQWRARTVDDLGQTSAWISAGGSDGKADFGVTALVPPLAPVLSPPVLNNGSVALSWTVPAGGATSYNVKRSTVSGGGGYPPATIIGSPTGNSFTDGTAVVGTTYFYVVSAVRTGLEGPNSNEVSITVAAGGGPAAGAAPDTESKSRCGLTGTEGILALAVLAALRRRRRK